MWQLCRLIRNSISSPRPRQPSPGGSCSPPACAPGSAGSSSPTVNARTTSWLSSWLLSRPALMPVADASAFANTGPNPGPDRTALLLLLYPAPTPTPGRHEKPLAAVGPHAQLVEDLQRAGQRPKLERHGDVTCVVVRSARYIDQHMELGEVHPLRSGLRSDPCRWTAVQGGCVWPSTTVSSKR